MATSAIAKRDKPQEPKIEFLPKGVPASWGKPGDRMVISTPAEVTR